MKRRLVKLAVFLLLGAIVNVAVAWGIAWSDRGQSQQPSGIASWSEDGCDQMLFLYRRTGFESVFWVRSRIGLSGPDYGSKRPVNLASWPWSIINQPALWPSLDSGLQFMDVAVGWPMLAMTDRFSGAWLGGGKDVNGDGIMLGSQPIGGGVVYHRALPLRLLWPGFAINTLFYAVILWGAWLLFAAPFALRRRIRIRRGLCPACAYPVGDSDVCTECGKPVMIKHKAETQKAEMT